MLIETFKKIKPIYVFLFFLAFYLLTFCMGGYDGHFYSIDGKVIYEQMKDIANGNLSLLTSPHKHLGLSLAEIPFYLIGECLSQLFHTPLNPFVALLVNPVVAALLCLVMFLIIRILSTQKTALIITVLYGFCTLVWPYSKSDITDPLFTLCFMAVFWALLNYNRSGQSRWFFISLVFMAATYVTKLAGHGFLLGWLFYIYITDAKKNVPIKKIAVKFLLMILVWCAFIPLSISINKAQSQSYIWSWFHEFGYKFLVREFSPLDGLFWYCPLLFLVFFSVRQFLNKAINEFIFIMLLFLPYFITLHLGKDVVCIYDFAGRYDMVYAPLLLIMLIPLVENFPKLHLSQRLACITVVMVGFYIQLLGSSVSILYYSNLIGGGLGLDWRQYAFSWQYSPWGIYPRLILQAITGLAVPVEGINNTSASIDGVFKLDYFWAVNSGVIFKVIALVLLGTVIGFGVYLFRRSQLTISLKKYFKEITILVVVLVLAWVVIFVPKELFTSSKTEIVNIDNKGFENFADSNGNVMPQGWGLIDYSSQNGQPSVSFEPNTSDVAEGKTSLEMVMNQDYVTISLGSKLFEVKDGEIVQASCRIKSQEGIPYSVRISFVKEGDPFYYSPTTRIKEVGNGWKELTSRVLVPKGALKAQFLINVWTGGLKKGSKALLDDVWIIKEQ